MQSISIYIHIPFCMQKCFYCDFNSYAQKNILIKSYIKALQNEIEMYSEQLQKFEIQTIFFGGGTPTILGSKDISCLLKTIKQNYHIVNGAEITIEANPGTLDKLKLIEYYKMDINRLSIGLQACQNHLLHSIGRIHTFEDFLTNLSYAREVGFTNINVDLMFALPGQKMQDWIETLEKIVSKDIPHISTYSLIIEEQTPIYEQIKMKKIEAIDEDIDLEMFHKGIEYLKKYGYTHYEISNFAKEGHECEHNKRYWKNQQYIGFGAGAHSYINSKRFYNFSGVEKYIECIQNKTVPVESNIIISRKDEISETMFLGLRMSEGISIQDFKHRFKQCLLTIYGEKLEKLKKQNLIIIDKENIRLTSKGIDLSNIVFEEMLL